MGWYDFRKIRSKYLDFIFITMYLIYWFSFTLIRFGGREWSNTKVCACVCVCRYPCRQTSSHLYGSPVHDSTVTCMATVQQWTRTLNTYLLILSFLCIQKHTTKPKQMAANWIESAENHSVLKTRTFWASILIRLVRLGWHHSRSFDICRVHFRIKRQHTHI